jgi:hypothetical protein
MSEITTYRELAEKYARHERIRSITAIVGGAFGIIGGALTLWQLRKDRRAVQGTVTRDAS